jgi:hypothetical protein
LNRRNEFSSNKGDPWTNFITFYSEPSPGREQFDGCIDAEIKPGTMQAMTRGTVSEAWGWTHHPAWFKEVTGLDPQQTLEEAQRKYGQRN